MFFSSLIELFISASLMKYPTIKTRTAVHNTKKTQKKNMSTFCFVILQYYPLDYAVNSHQLSLSEPYGHHVSVFICLRSSERSFDVFLLLFVCLLLFFLIQQSRISDESAVISNFHLSRHLRKQTFCTCLKRRG